MSLRVSDRVSRVTYRSYAVTDLAGVCLDNRPDSSPAGRNGTFFFQNIWLGEQMFWKKIKTYHAAAGESGFHRVKRPV